MSNTLFSNTAQPIIIQTGAGSAYNKNGLKLSPQGTMKIVFSILILVVVGEIIWGAWSLTRPIPKYLQPKESLAFDIKPRLALASNKKIVKPGDNFRIDVLMLTGGKDITAADLVVTYDPNLVSMEGSPSAIFTKGTIFSDYPLVDSKTPGVVRVSGVSELSSVGFKGIEVFGSLNFKAKKSGTAAINIDYEPGSTTDSNLTDRTALDILGDVKGVTIEARP